VTERGPAAARRRGARRGPAGFTLVELVTVIAIVGILGALGMSRFADRAAFDARGFAPRLLQFVSAGQRLAVAQRRTIHVSVDPAADRVTLCLDAACALPIAAGPRLSGDDPAWLAVPPGLRIAGAAQTFSFAPDGTPSFAAATSLRLTDRAGNDLNAGITLEPGSGHARTF
jgi:MSHA pilin protein MshC